MSARWTRNRLGKKPLTEVVIELLCKQPVVTPIEVAGRAACSRKAAEHAIGAMFARGELVRVARGQYGLPAAMVVTP